MLSYTFLIVLKNLHSYRKIKKPLDPHMPGDCSKQPVNWQRSAITTSRLSTETETGEEL